MQEATPQTTAATDDDDARLESLGYQPQLNRVLGLFSNFRITLVVMVVVFLVGLVLFAFARGGRELDQHMRDDAEKPAAVR